MVGKFKFNILTGENAPEKYNAINPKDPSTFYLLETGAGYLGEKKMFDSVADTIDTINPDAPGTGIPTEAAIVNYVIEAIRDRVPYEIDGVPSGELSGNQSSGNAIVEDSPIGTIISYMGTVAPGDYLVCDGAEQQIAQYPELASFFERQFGTKNHFGGDGTTTFAVPDLRNLFLRGYHSSATEQLSGEIGERQEATQHVALSIGENNWLGIPGTNNTILAHQLSDSHSSSESRSRGTTTGDGRTNIDNQGIDYSYYTSRPVNTAVLYCIKAVTSVPAENVYLTEEQVVGRWIDGKPIYQKTFIFENVTGTNASFVVIGTISDIDLVIEAKGTSYSTGLAYLTSAGGGMFVCIQNDKKTLVVRQGWASKAVTYSGAATVQYTKTTD